MGKEKYINIFTNCLLHHLGQHEAAQKDLSHSLDERNGSPERGGRKRGKEEEGREGERERGGGGGEGRRKKGREGEREGGEEEGSGKREREREMKNGYSYYENSVSIRQNTCTVCMPILY